VTGPIYGKADIFVDGVRKRTVNLYATSRHFNASRSVTGLANKSHRLRIVVLGVKGNKSANGTFVAVDAFHRRRHQDRYANPFHELAADRQTRICRAATQL